MLIRLRALRLGDTAEYGDVPLSTRCPAEVRLFDIVSLLSLSKLEVSLLFAKRRAALGSRYAISSRASGATSETWCGSRGEEGERERNKRAIATDYGLR